MWFFSVLSVQFETGSRNSLLTQYHGLHMVSSDQLASLLTVWCGEGHAGRARVWMRDVVGFKNNGGNCYDTGEGELSD